MQNWQYPSWYIGNRERTLDLGIIFLIPLVLLLNNENWLYTDVGWTDPWSYLSRFLHYDTANEFIDYKVVRFPWIWSGFAAYRLFSPETATTVLGLSYLYLALFSFYLILARLFSTRSAFVTTVLLACYMEFHSPYGWLYHNMAATAFYFLSLLLFIHAADAPRRQAAWLFSGGIILFLTVCTNMAYLPFLPFPFIFFYFIYFSGKKPTFRQAAVTTGVQLFWVTLGGTLTAALTTYIHGAVTGAFWMMGETVNQLLGMEKLPVFLVQLEYAINLQEWIAGAIAADEREMTPLALLLKNSAFLVIPIVLFLISLGRLGWLGAGMTGLWSGKKRLGENRKSLFEIPIHAQHIIVCLAYFSLYTKGSPIFWASFQSFPLIGTSFLAIGAFLFRFGPGMRLFSYPALRMTVLALSVLLLIILFHSLFLEKYNLDGWSFFIFPLVFCIISFSLFLSRTHSKLIFVLFLVGFMSVNILAANRPYLVRPYIYDKCYPRKDAALAAFEGIKYLDSIDILHTHMAYIYDYHDELSMNIDLCERHKLQHPIFEMAVSISVSHDGWANKKNLVENDHAHPPGHPEDMTSFIQQLPANKKIAVISSLHSSGDRLSRLHAAADSVGRTITEIGRRTVRSGDVAYEIVVFSAP